MTQQVGWLTAWMSAGALLGATVALWQEVPARQIPFWVVVGVLVALVGKLVRLMSEDEQQRVVARAAAPLKQSHDHDAAKETTQNLPLALPEQRLTPAEARTWLDDLLVKQQSGPDA